MKNRIKFSWLLLTILTSSMLLAAIPSGYYDTASGLTGNDLRLALHNIINDHTEKSYDDVWTAFKTTDVRTIDEHDYIWCMYTHINFEPGTDQQGANPVMAKVYNREHSWPKSWANESYPHYTDLYHLYPVQGTANSTRNNNAYGEVADGQHTYISNNGTKSGPARPGLGYTGTVFELIDEYKGDLARTYFYISTRYYTEDSDWGEGDWPMSNKCELKDWAIDMLLNWHKDDPVSQKERDRIEEVYAIQGNRNPFIDHPEFVEFIWDQPMTGFIPPRAKAASFIQEDGFTANWSAVTEATGYNLYVSLSSDFSNCISGYDPYDAGNTQAKIVSGLASSTLYYYRITAYREGEESANSNIINVKTAPPTGIVDSTKIFLSEYIEGSSNNKALEIYNATGKDINLAKINIKTYFNGNTSSTGNLSLSGTLLNDDVYVIANNNAVSTISSIADLITNSQAITYNGNDVIELYYNNCLIDIIGVVGQSADYAKDVTLVRKPEIVNGNTTYHASEWDEYPMDTFSYLGYHTVNDEPLAISLRYFEGSYQDGQIFLNWSTESETENTAFQIFRNKEFLASLEGSGTTSVTKYYEYIDRFVLPGQVYTYALNNIDYSGNNIAHDAILVTITTPGGNTQFLPEGNIGAAYPNPFNPITILPLHLNQGNDVSITLYNIYGRKCLDILSGYYAPGDYQIPIHASSLSSGIYIVHIRIGMNKVMQKIVLFK